MEVPILSPSLRQQLQHMEWADARLWEAVRASDTAREDARLRELLHHVHLVQHLYLQIWRGESLTISKAESFADLDELHDWARGFYAPAVDLLGSLSSSGLEGSVDFPWAAQLAQRFGVVHPATLEESVIQIVIHTGHHRGQLFARLRELGAEPPLVDFIAWVWQGKPAPVWPDLPAS